MSARRVTLLPFLWLCKLSLVCSRLFAFGGSTLPGRLLLFFSLDLFVLLKQQIKEGYILVSGTNGKTTTSFLMERLFSCNGKEVLHNSSGSNMLWGIASTLVDRSSWYGQIQADLGVLEVDEGNLPVVSSLVNPKGIVLTNIFPDQLDRFKNWTVTRDYLQKGLQAARETEFVALNADDPCLTGLQVPNTAQILYYGLSEGLEINTSPVFSRNNGPVKCLQCGQTLFYKKKLYAHLGHYFCPGCGLKRPRPDVSLLINKQTFDKTNFSINSQKTVFGAELLIPGFYNLYNALAAISCGLYLKVSPEQVQAALQSAAPLAGRMELLLVQGKKVALALVKNSAGVEEVLRHFSEVQGTALTFLIAVNSHIADGKDTTWLRESNFEILAHYKSQINQIICSGSEVMTLSARLKKTGLDKEVISCEKNLKIAFRRCLKTVPHDGLIVILPSYTALQEIEKILSKTKHAKLRWGQQNF